jgi:hypothetical protein
VFTYRFKFTRENQVLGVAMDVAPKETASKRLLVMACSSRKLPDTGVLPALRRYDGVAFRVVKRLQRLSQFPRTVDVLILSAKYGLITADRPIPDYDLRMSPALARAQAQENCTTLRKVVESRPYDDVFISVGRVYLQALEPFEAWRSGCHITVNRGKIGCQLRGLKSWLLATS